MCSETPNRWQSLLFCADTSTFCCHKAAEEGSCCDNPKLAFTLQLPGHVMSTLSSVNPVAQTGSPVAISGSTPTVIVASTSSVGEPTTLPQSQTGSKSTTPQATTPQATSTSQPTSTFYTTTKSTMESAPSNSTIIPNKTSGSSPSLSTSDIVAIVCALTLGIPTLAITFLMFWRQGVVRIRIENAVKHWWKYG